MNKKRTSQKQSNTQASHGSTKILESPRPIKCHACDKEIGNNEYAWVCSLMPNRIYCEKIRSSDTGHNCLAGYYMDVTFHEDQKAILKVVE
jgi:hypothetical protein